MGSSERVLSKRTARRAFDLSTFVSVGNAKQPFNRLIEAVISHSDHLPQPVFCQYGTCTINDWGRVDGVPFLQMEEFSERVQKADLLILHAGAGSAIHAVRALKVPIVVPRLALHEEHVDDHQVEFAEQFAATGRVVICHELRDLPDCVELALQRQAERGTQVDVPPMLGLLQDSLNCLAEGK